MRPLRHLTALALLALALVVVAPAGEARSVATTQLRLDGIAFRPELATTPEQRAFGLMQRRKAPADGMLFVFQTDTNGSFWMKDTLVPLTIVFFDRRGRQVRRLSMKPCKNDPCAIYSPRRIYRFALELPATDTRPAKLLGPLAKLVRLSANAI